MRDESFPPQDRSLNGARSGTSEGELNLSNAAVRILAGLGALLAFLPAGICFYFLVEPFGKNPPPKEVALIAGIVFAAFGLFMAGVAIFSRGSRPAPQRDSEPAHLDSPDIGQRWAPPGGGANRPLRAQSALAPPSIKRSSLKEFVSVAACIGIVIGIGVGYFAHQRQVVLERGKAEPRSLSVAEFGRNGPGDNIHMKLSDIEYGENYSVRSKGGSWIAVCLAAFPRGSRGDPRALKVVIRSTRIHNERELQEFERRATVQGVVVNSIYESQNDREYMKTAYPGVDTSSIWVVQEDFTFPSTSEIQTMYGVSGAIVGISVFCGIGAFVRKGS